ncbi:Zinc finger CCCH domain-containing protein 13 [Argiope bruennichi]|uniref:Zinc finger CCCH domain-containing protein 13 n=1 Tax=Argiope bruennichi TaxID=94029 RepID=A0A8T0F4P4_ARGBR|nr:Zinc finger CCCH domain-containing protein 13 [Argiope bruennichi]
MPRRRRASPDWQRNRVDDRDPGMNSNHRQNGRGQGLSSEARSRSPKGPGTSRGSWSDRGGRHDNRSGEGKQYEDSQKDRNLDDRKGRNIRKDRGKLSKEEPLVDEKIFSAKEKPLIKRPHSPSPSPSVKAKKRRNNDIQMFDIMRYHGSEPPEKVSSVPIKKIKEEAKSDAKPIVSRNQKSGKQDVSPPKIDNSERCEPSSKTSTENKTKEKEERKSRKNDDGTHGDDDFSDWSDDDDDLLTRDDFVETERSSENIEDGSSNNSRRKERHGAIKDTLQDLKKDKDVGNSTNSRDRSNEEIPHSKESKSVIGKDTDAQESLSVKEDTATDVDEYITAESVDYDPISDDELDALIEEPDDTLIKPTAENEKSKIVNALEVDWSTLMSETKTTDFIPGFARQRFKAAHVLSRIGFSQVFAGPELSEKIINICQKQLEEEVLNEDKTGSKEGTQKSKKFIMEHPLAAFHVAVSQNKQERANLFNKVGPFRRALCARRDLHIRKVLCRPLNKLSASTAITYTPQFTVVDKELYKQSLEFLKLKKPVETQPQAVDVC